MSKKNLSSLKVSELRELCKRRDLTQVFRSKAEMIRRLSEKLGAVLRGGGLRGLDLR